MSKYAPLFEYLHRQKEHTVRLSFGEVEKILGFKLPRSAYLYRAWWSNNPNNSVMTKAWRRAKFRSRDVDMERQKVVFERSQTPAEELVTKQKSQKAMAELRARIAAHKTQQEARHHPLRGALKGVLKLVGGTDLTKPVESWNDK